jgi:putative IMPACT (imprinted ancient) family translation regulator
VIETAFQWTGQVYPLLEQAGAKKTGESYPEGAVHLEIEIVKARLPALRRALGDATRGEAVVRILSTD